MSKGSRQRPTAISQELMRINWALIFEIMSEEERRLLESRRDELMKVVR